MKTSLTPPPLLSPPSRSLSHLIPPRADWCEQPWQVRSIGLKPVQSFNPSVVSREKRRGQGSHHSPRAEAPPHFSRLNGQLEKIVNQQSSFFFFFFQLMCLNVFYEATFYFTTSVWGNRRYLHEQNTHFDWLIYLFIDDLIWNVFNLVYCDVDCNLSNNLCFTHFNVATTDFISLRFHS